MKKVYVSLLIVVILLTAAIVAMLFLNSNLVPGRKQYTEPEVHFADTQLTTIPVIEVSTAPSTEAPTESTSLPETLTTIPPTEAPTEAPKETSYVQNDVTYYVTDDYDYTILEDGTAAIYAYHGDKTDVYFPQTLDGIPVTALCGEMSTGKAKSVTIPGNIRTFLGNPFPNFVQRDYVIVKLEENHPYLKAENGCIYHIETGTLLSCYSSYDRSFTIPEGTIRIGDSAFYGSRFTAIHIPNTVTYIGNKALNGDEIREITIPNSVEYISGTALPRNIVAIHVSADHPVYTENNGCLIEKQNGKLITYAGGREDSHYEIPSGVTEIGDYAFSYGKNLDEVIVPSGVRTIGEYAFCWTYADIILPNTITDIQEAAFMRSGSVDLSGLSNLTHLATHALAWCNMPETAVIPGSVGTIEPFTFYVTGRSQKIILEEGITSIGSGAFNGSTITELVIPASVNEIADSICNPDTAEKLLVTVVPGSYAETYCNEHEIAVQYA